MRQQAVPKCVRDGGRRHHSAETTAAGPWRGHYRQMRHLARPAAIPSRRGDLRRRRQVPDRALHGLRGGCIRGGGDGGTNDHDYANEAWRAQARLRRRSDPHRQRECDRDAGNALHIARDRDSTGSVAGSGCTARFDHCPHSNATVSNSATMAQALTNGRLCTEPQCLPGCAPAR